MHRYRDLIGGFDRKLIYLLMMNVYVSVDVNVPINLNIAISVDVPINVHISANMDVPIDVNVLTVVISAAVTVSVMVVAVS